MITVAKDVIKDVRDHVRTLAELPMIKAASKLPGYAMYEAAINTLAEDALLPKPDAPGPAERSQGAADAGRDD